MGYTATKQRVANRGAPPDAFLDELVAWGKQAPDEIFVINASHDIYSSVFRELGPWEGIQHRRAVMLEVLRVLAGFESSWKWNEGRDTTNPTSVTPETIEAGAWQVSANSMNFGQELKDLVRARVGTLDGNAFQRAMKQDHKLAMEYIARLLRRTTKHNGPVKRREINEWLRRDAVAEFQALLSSEGAALMLLPQVCGNGYYSYEPVNRQFGTAATINALQEVAQTFRLNMPNVEIGIGDISFAQGGPMSPHKSHQHGTDVDIRPFRKDGTQKPVSIIDPQYDREMTRLLVQSLLAHRNVKGILFNDTQIHGVQFYAGHHNHLHVKMKQ
jgi:hypothetical protein